MTRRALVLGGGGITGIAWEWGLLAGFARAGVNLGAADLVIGTSAGSVVGAQIANGLSPEERYEAQLVPPDGEIAAVLGPRVLLRMGLALALGPRAGARRRIGRAALRAQTGDEAVRLAVIDARLPVKEWPAERDLSITAVDTATGEFRAFNRDAGVPLVSAVAASCAVPGVWPPVTVDGRRYMDGGMRSATNADLAAGYDKVVVLAPVTRGVGQMASVAQQAEVLRAQSTVEVVTPDAAARTAFGRNLLDPARRAPAARAGLAQSAAVVDAVRAVWES